MTMTIKPETLLAWSAEFVEEIRGGCRRYRQRVLGHLVRFQEHYESAHPGGTFLETLDRTEVLAQWVKRPEFLAHSQSTRRSELVALRGFTAWLLESGRTEHDAYFYVPTGQAVRGEVPDLVLHLNLQPEILRFREKISQTEPHRPVHGTWVRAAHLFNRYRNQPEELTQAPEQLLVGWLKTLPLRRPVRTRVYLTGLVRFSEFVADPARVPDVAGWLSGYRSRMAVIRSLADQTDLAEVEKRARFQSELAGWLEAFLEFQGAKKMRLDCIEVELRRLDRLAHRHAVKSPEELTRAMLMEFLGENEPAPATFNQRLARLRGFRRFLLRKQVRLNWPTGLSNRPVPAFRPHLYTLAEIGRLLEWLESVGSQGRHDPFRWWGLKNIVFLLYAAGLRLREPLRLRLRDVDLEGRLLFIDNTKFYKQRWVPIGERASRRLASYFEQRCRLFPERGAKEDAFFLNSQGNPLQPCAVEDAFGRAIDALGLRGRGTRSKPRLHDLRHSAAVHKLYQWYSEGKDVQSKLPLLSAYLGHDKLQHTEVYLHLTEDLLRLAGGKFRASFESVVGQVPVS